MYYIDEIVGLFYKSVHQRLAITNIRSLSQQNLLPEQDGAIRKRRHRRVCQSQSKYRVRFVIPLFNGNSYSEWNPYILVSPLQLGRFINASFLSLSFSFETLMSLVSNQDEINSTQIKDFLLLQFHKVLHRFLVQCLPKQIQKCCDKKVIGKYELG